MNKFQESLDRIKKNLPLHEDSWTDEDKEHIITIMEALEKQIPKKPFEENRYYGQGECPTCGAVFVDKSTQYCGNCGQAIDWSDTE